METKENSPLVYKDGILKQSVKVLDKEGSYISKIFPVLSKKQQADIFDGLNRKNKALKCVFPLY